MGSVDLRKFQDPPRLAQSAAADWLETISKMKSSQQRVCVALAGGRIAQTFLSTLARLPATPAAIARSVHFFWGDERCVPPTDPESNFRLAYDALLKPLNVSNSQLHRIQGERPQPEACPSAESELRQFVVSSTAGQPVLDLVLLGIGEEGHVASLFPGEPEAVLSSPAVFRGVTALKPPPLRITLGYPALAVAREVWVLASGPGKQAALRQSLTPGGGTPLARVLKLRTATRIYTDIAV